MQIDLNQFEELVEEPIFKRGLSYFKKGLVTNFEEIAPNKYKAIVEGSENYQLSFRIQNNVITEHSCSCPYVAGPVCKHLVAGVFHLKQEEWGIKKSKKKSPTKKVSKVSKELGEVDDLLGQISYQDLQAFVRDLAEKNKIFREQFLTSFIHLNSKDDFSLYQNQVKAIIKKVSTGRYFDSYQLREVGHYIHELLDQTENYLKNKNYRSYFSISMAVMLEGHRMLKYNYDDNAEIQSMIYRSVELIQKLKKADIDEALRKEMLKQIFGHINKDKEEFNHWTVDLFHYASSLLEDKDINKFKKLLEKIKSLDNENWRLGTIKCIEYSLILHTEGEEKAEAFLIENQDNAHLIERAVNLALKQKDYDQVIKLATPKFNKYKNHSYWAEIWAIPLLEVAIIRKDTERIIQYARHLFLYKANNTENQEKYYSLLKEHIKERDWKDFALQMIEEVKNLQLGVDTFLYIKEGYWDKLLEEVRTHTRLQNIDYYAHFFPKEYNAQVVDCYRNAIFEHFKLYADKKDYIRICQYFRKMIKRGARAEVEALVEELRTKYANRPSLLRELSQL